MTVREQQVDAGQKNDVDAPLVGRYFTKGIHPFETVQWETRDAVLGDPAKPVFEQKGLEFPASWSQNATNIVAQKYFRGKMNSPEREHSVRQMIARVADTITTWGIDGGYFKGDEEATTFNHELSHLLVTQKMAFNSPVWFNLGHEAKPQCSACFILSVDDDMDSILNWITEEGTVFKGGSGSGVNLSRIRSSVEQLAKGGHASGPVSFMRGADSSAGTIKSGGKTRRAAKMVVLNIDHPDIEEFIWCKSREEEKARALAAAGFDMALNSDNWNSIQYQNANNSVRVTDDFMQAVVEDREWATREVTTGNVAKIYRARDLMLQISDAAHRCADPGLQYDTTINDWHTCPQSGRINGSNPCSEYMHVDNSACNLASLNLMKFVDERGVFDVDAYERAIDTTITAQEIIVGPSSYPIEQIGKNARAMRQLGLGYANLGALLMSEGLPYDSDKGRGLAAALTALMTGRAYRQSARLAKRMGAYDAYELNKADHDRVMEQHRAAISNIKKEFVPGHILDAARRSWDEAIELGKQHGYRNAQATVLAPTGTISFMMDCDTTGIEPDFSLVKSKKLVGGGDMHIVNQTVPRALAKLGYQTHEIDQIVAYIGENNSVVGAPNFKEEHYEVFDCAVGARAISYMGHVNMMGATQPFLSGAISKTVNLPEDATVEQIMDLYVEAWKLGVKAIAIYRDNCKTVQPLATKKETVEDLEQVEMFKPVRREMPLERTEFGRKFQVGDYEGYIHVGVYEDGTPGDIFVNIAKEGTTLAGLMNSLMISVSLGLQYGVPLKVYVSKFSHMRFEPSGLTNDTDIRTAKSLVDYIFRWMGKKFLTVDDQQELGILTPEVRARLATQYAETEAHAAAGTVAAPAERAATPSEGQSALFNAYADAQECARCGGRKIRTGACYTCTDCGDNTGCG
ncbi:MAG: vitamin B12-dependent ribonucleotide reductase [Thermoleophilia bacterium]|nr:vitamin B12-dependent ribonucleotide reductase [Thermoleophilia bacterium]